MSVGNTKKFVVKNGTVTPNVEFVRDEFAQPTVGQLQWNLDAGTLDLGLNGTGVVLQVGQETLYRVKNQTGSNIPNGTLCMFAGTLGQSGRLLVAPWDGNQPSQFIMGIATEDILDGEDGFVTHFGKVRGINTTGTPYGESWSNGDILYAGPTGGLTNVKPDAPNVKTIVAVVISAHQSVGTLFVRPTFSSNLDDDDLVELDNLQDGDILQYVAAEGRFENTQIDISGSGIDWVKKTTTYTAESGDHIIADTTGGAFTINLPPTPETGDFVVFVDGGDWETNNLTVGRNGSTIEGLSNNLVFDISAIRVELIYDGVTWQVYAATAPEIKTLSAGSSEIGALSYNGTTRAAGKLYGGTTDPQSTQRLNYDGHLYVNDLNAINVNSTSDKRAKTNIVTIENALNKVLQLRGVEFDWKESGKHAIGVIAQEVEQIVPEIVSDNGKTKSVSYGNLIGLMIEAIKELNDKMEGQK